MASLASSMPPVVIDREELKVWGERWASDKNSTNDKPKAKNALDKQQSVNFASFIDQAVARSLAAMLGGIPVIQAKKNVLTPSKVDCIETGQVTIIGGVRPQNFDVAYRPDGPRIAFDSKTLNDKKSIAKNWQNMINDLATEATTVHIRFPYALVAFIVVVPKPALAPKQELDIIRTLERLGNRRDVLDQAQLAEAIALVVWDPSTGEINTETPPPDSNLRIEKFSERLFPHYLERYKGLPPHNVAPIIDDKEDGE